MAKSPKTKPEVTEQKAAEPAPEIKRAEKAVDETPLFSHPHGTRLVAYSRDVILEPGVPTFVNWMLMSEAQRVGVVPVNEAGKKWAAESMDKIAELESNREAALSRQSRRRWE